jgi:hypothetical protein
METGSTSHEMAEDLGRWLYSDTSNSASDEEMLRNRILYIAYLCVLGCCCITPCLYYIRVSSWQRRQFREFREMERNAILAALAQSTANSAHHMSISAELAIVHSERRARIIQLMEPVRMVRIYDGMNSVFNSETFFSLPFCRLYKESISNEVPLNPAVSRMIRSRKQSYNLRKRKAVRFPNKKRNRKLHLRRCRIQFLPPPTS